MSPSDSNSEKIIKIQNKNSLAFFHSLKKCQAVYMLLLS